jgi:ABC-type nitrate/sulfonate/bicarbonate transport system substrate-binding protein
MKRLLLFITITVCLAACTKSDKSAKGGEKIKLRFGEINVSERAIPIYLGVKKGFFAEQGIDLEIRRFNGGRELMTAAAANEVDAGSVGTPVLLAAAKGLPVRIVGSPVAPGNPFVLVGLKQFNSVADLKGKKIGGGNLGGGSRQAFIAIAKANGLKLSDFQVLDTGGSSNAFAALQAGQLDGAITSGLSAAKAELSGFGTVLARASDFFGHYQHSYFFATQKIIDSRPETIKGFLAAYRKSIQYVKEHPDEAIAFGVKELELEEQPLRKVLTRDLPTWDDKVPVDLEGTDNAIKAIKEIGDLESTNPLTAAQVVDQRFMPQ